jgi:hypothetical protein
MQNDFLNLNSLTNQDIAKYLYTAFKHLNIIIIHLQNLTLKESEKDHVIDILNECLYIKNNINLLFNIYKNCEDEETLNKIELLFQNVFSIEEELSSDYPDLFKNNDGIWWKYNRFLQNFSLKTQQLNQQSTKKRNYNFKFLIFCLFSLLLFFLFFKFYSLIINKTNTLDENKFKQYIYEDDRAYKNIFYIYSAILFNKNYNNNFYSLFKNSSFQMPDGLVIIDKNLIVDYYLKEYYRIKHIENEPNITIISVTNLNNLQCKYILTKFSAISIEKIIVNEQIVDFNNLKSEIYCNKEYKLNTISLYIKK